MTEKISSSRLVPAAAAAARRIARSAFAGALLSGVACLGLASIGLGFGAAQAQDAASKGSNAVFAGAPPLPPMRPAALTPPQPAAPPAQVLAPPETPALPPGQDPMVSFFSPDMPQELPPAPRGRMHACGAKWQQMKASGAAADKTWRAFAVVCLAGQGKD